MMKTNNKNRKLSRIVFARIDSETLELIKKNSSLGISEFVREALWEKLQRLSDNKEVKEIGNDRER